MLDRLGKLVCGKPLAWGSQNRSPNGPERPLERVFIENLPGASVKNALRSANRPRSCRAPCRARTRHVVGSGRKVASWKALVKGYKWLPIDESRDAGLLQKRKRRTASRVGRSASLKVSTKRLSWVSALIGIDMKASATVGWMCEERI